MKTIKKQKKLVLILGLLASLFMQSCASLRKSEVRGRSAPKIGSRRINPSKIKSSLPPRFEHFDKKSFPNDYTVVANMISVVQPELDARLRDAFATYISKATSTYKIEPQIIVAIIDTESDFKAEKVSTTGDLSLAQINVEIWNKEFIRMKMAPMIKEKIKKDPQYALMKMGEILSIIKRRYAKADSHWYARYHSNTLKYKKDYLYKLEVRLKQIALSKYINNKMASNN